MNPELKQDDDNDPLVVARLNKDKLAFSVPSKFSELYEAVNKALPADTVYFVVEGKDGFAFREAGRLVLQFVPTEALAAPATPVAPPQLSSQLDSRLDSQPESQDAPERIEAPQSIPEPSPAPKRRSKAKQRPVPGKGVLATDGFTPATAADEAAASCFGKISSR